MKRIKQFFWKSYRCIFPPKCIRLAVVGSRSSGKSFLLRDVYTAFRLIGTSPFRSYSLEHKDGFKYNSISNFSPNQKGTDGGTPLYACRQKDHHGQLLKGGGLLFDLCFLNIPGEIFSSVHLRRYSELKTYLSTSKKWFTVNTYKGSAGDMKLIVKPDAKLCPLGEKETALADKMPDDETLDTCFKTWDVINLELKDGDYKKKRTKRISGNQLLRYLFKYDIDSVMLSISELIAKDTNKQLSFDQTDFENDNEGLCFVFFHYCTQATDIVLCDRVFTHKKENETETNEISFSDLSSQISDFIDEEHLNTNVYLAFRNVDFLIHDKEEAYVKLNKQLKNKLQENIESSKLARYNVIYSLFSYLLFDCLEYNVSGMGSSTDYIVGLDQEHINASSVSLPDSMDNSTKSELRDLYLDTDGSDGFIYKAEDLKSHIESRIGGSPGQAFRGILSKVGWEDNDDGFVPHVYFTSTPITADYEVYKNGDKSKGQNEFGFYRGSSIYPFANAGSSACFGSLQLCLDILYQHGMGSFFSHSGMLSNLINLKS